MLVNLSCIFSVYGLLCHFSILVDMNPQNWINIFLFELVVMCIETHILVPNFSISHIFISVIKSLCYSLLLGQLINRNIQHSKTCIQNNPYTIFEQISSFSCFVFSHMRLQRVTLISRKGVLSSICKVTRMYASVQDPEIRV